MDETIRIQVLDPAGLHHFASGFHAWEPGEYDFPADPAYRGWLQGHAERGAVKILGEEPPDAGATPPGETGEPGPLAEAGFVVGARVEYTSKDGTKKSEHTIQSVNGDGTFNLGGVLRKAPRAQLRLLGPEE